MLADTIDIKINPTAHSRLAETDFDNLRFGKIFSDHMFVADYADGQWQNLEIVPYGPLSLSPAISALHYGQAFFEGLKAYRTANGQIQIFRPQANAARLNQTAARLSMPALDEHIFMAALDALIGLDQNWVPDRPEGALYIRPFMFATDAFVGIRPSETYKFIIFTTPVARYYNEPVRVRIERHYTRAAAGGMGFAKAAGNYAGALYPTRLAQEQGFHQLLWTDAKEHKYFEESGTMNIMFVVNGKLLSPVLSDSILAGITRDSFLTIARQMGYEVEERRISVEEIISAIEKGELQEAFGCGTAALVAHIEAIGFEDRVYDLPALEPESLSIRIKNKIGSIRQGISEDTNNWMWKVGG